MLGVRISPWPLWICGVRCVSTALDFFGQLPFIRALIDSRGQIQWPSESKGARMNSKVAKGRFELPSLWFEHRASSSCATRPIIFITAEGKGFEPSSLIEPRVSSAVRPTVSGYLPNSSSISNFKYFKFQISNALSGPTGNRTRIACLQGRHPPIERQARRCLPPSHARQRVIPDGVEPPSPGCKPGVVAVGQRDRGKEL